MDIRSTYQWEQFYKGQTFRDGGKEFYRQVESEGLWVGRYYMEGQLSCEQVRDWLCNVGTYWPYDGFSKSTDLLRKGVQISLKMGLALESRIQPDNTHIEKELKMWKKTQNNVQKFLNKNRPKR